MMLATGYGEGLPQRTRRIRPVGIAKPRQNGAQERHEIGVVTRLVAARRRNISRISRLSVRANRRSLRPESRVAEVADAVGKVVEEQNAAVIVGGPVNVVDAVRHTPPRTPGVSGDRGRTAGHRGQEAAHLVDDPVVGPTFRTLGAGGRRPGGAEQDVLGPIGLPVAGFSPVTHG